MRVTAQNDEIKMYGLVRDSKGIPKVDDISKCPQAIIDLLTDKEIEDIKNGTNPYNSN